MASALLRAAYHPLRDVTVGESGVLMTMLARFLPEISDRLYSFAFYRTARDPDQPKRNAQALHQPGSDGKVLGDQKDRIHETSIYSTAQLYPNVTRAVGIGMAALAAALIVGRQQSRKAARRRPLARLERIASLHGR